MAQLVLIVHAAATWFMVGLIWLVQLVHYAQFDGVGESGWADYHRRHTTNITLIVGPAMLIELLAATWLVWQRPAAVPAWAVWIGLATVGLLWLSTALVQVPLHNKLAGGLDLDVARRLTATNWVRTAVWTFRGVLAAWMLWRVMVPVAR